jgi:hypothetical protein
LSDDRSDAVKRLDQLVLCSRSLVNLGNRTKWFVWPSEFDLPQVDPITNDANQGFPKSRRADESVSCNKNAGHDVGSFRPQRRARALVWWRCGRNTAIDIVGL